MLSPLLSRHRVFGLLLVLAFALSSAALSAAALAALPEAAVLHRAPVLLPPPSPVLARRHRSLSLTHVVVSHAGRQPLDAPEHRAIAALRTGDALTLRTDGTRRLLVAADGTVVGRLAKGYVAESGCTCVAATVAAAPATCTATSTSGTPV